jgi:hypothetical protein
VLSFYSMGLDVADVDDDGWPDVYTTDMLPEDTRRMKTVSSFDGWDTYQAKLRNGYGHQLMRNMLQRNNGDGTFAEVGQMAGVSRTDWSWSACSSISTSTGGRTSTSPTASTRTSPSRTTWRSSPTRRRWTPSRTGAASASTSSASCGR